MLWLTSRFLPPTASWPDEVYACRGAENEDVLPSLSLSLRNCPQPLPEAGPVQVVLQMPSPEPRRRTDFLNYRSFFYP